MESLLVPHTQQGSTLSSVLSDTEQSADEGRQTDGSCQESRSQPTEKDQKGTVAD